MTLFDSTKTIIGLFSDPKEMEKALMDLHEQGFGEEEENLQVINGEQVEQQPQIMIAAPVSSPGQIAAGSVPLVVDELVEDAGVDGPQQQRNMQERFKKMGLDDEEATFYAQNLARGSTVVVLETDEEHVAQAMETLDQFRARAVVA
jgi:hypothetical protein